MSGRLPFLRSRRGVGPRRAAPYPPIYLRGEALPVYPRDETPPHLRGEALPVYPRDETPPHLRGEALPPAQLALENARLHQAEQQARERVERLQQVTAALSRAATPTEIGEVVVGDGLRLLGGDIAVLFLAVEGEPRIELVAHDGLSEEVIRAVRSLPLASSMPTVRAFLEGRAVFIESAEEYERAYPESAAAPQGRSSGVAAFTSIPLCDRHGARLGVVTLGYRRNHPFPAADRAFLLALAELCAQALERARLFAVERRLRAAAEEASRLKDEFLATVSHEVRTPLTAILGWAAMLRGPSASDPNAVRRAAEIIERNAKAQARIIDDILDVSRIVNGKLNLEPEPVDFGPLVRDAVDTVRHAAAAKSIDVTVHADRGPYPLVGDPDRLRQIAWNLLSNAVRYTNRGGHVRVELRRVGEHVELLVADDGRGIDPSFLPFVFDPFRQADGSSTRAQGGLGLGLAIVRKMVELHGGTVSAASEGLGRGATFVVSLPAEARPSSLPPSLSLRSAPPSAGPFSNAASAPSIGAANGASTPLIGAANVASAPSFGAANASPRAQLAGVRVLVVDDDPDARDLFDAIFSSAGANVHASSSADEALDVLDVFRPDVLVADIGMPERNGYSLLSAIRARPDALGALPAIAVTAYAHPDDAARAFSAGYQRHVPKPVEPPHLVATVRSVLGRGASSR